MPGLREGGRILVDQLLVQRVTTAFCVPGESYLPVLDGLYGARDRIRLVVARHEGAAAHMAEANGKLTGRPGICFVTRGPGLTQASVGLHTAFQDSTPLIVMVGQVDRSKSQRDAFQEIDYRFMQGQLAKWVGNVDDVTRIPEFVGRAFRTAISERPGPVVLVLPIDVLKDKAEIPNGRYVDRIAVEPPASAIADLTESLGKAQRPMVLLGGSGWTNDAVAHMRGFLQRNNLPAVAAWRRQDLQDNRDRNYVGHMAPLRSDALAQRIRDADVILAIGTRFDEITTGSYSLLRVPTPTQTLIHVSSSGDDLGKIYQPDLSIHAGIPELASALEHISLSQGEFRWDEWTRTAHDDELRNRLPAPHDESTIDLAIVFNQLRSVLPDNAIVCNGAGNYAAWLHRYFEYRDWPSQVAPISGCMGYGLPAAIAAKLLYPDRAVVAVAGDGCFQMSLQELATAVQYELPIVVLVINNGMYGTIRMNQERRYPGRVHATSLVNPDFAALARAFGASGELVETGSEFLPALERALAEHKPALIEIRTSSEVLAPDTTIEGIRSSVRS